MKNFIEARLGDICYTPTLRGLIECEIIGLVKRDDGSIFKR